MSFRVEQEEELEEVAGRLLRAFPHVRIFLLYGELGAGKTTLVKAFCRLLGVPDMVGSPTYSLINEYRRRDGEAVFHFDLYRLKGVAEMYDLGYEDYFFSGAYCFVEWPERMESLLAFRYCRVEIEEQAGVRIIRANLAGPGGLREHARPGGTD